MTKKLLVYSLLVVLAVALYSCTKDFNLRQDEQSRSSLSLSDAKVFFEATYQSLSVKPSRSASFDSSLYSRLDIGDFTPLWNKSISTSDECVSAIDVPIISQQQYNAIIKTPHDSSVVMVNTTQRLGVIKNRESGEMTTFIAIRVPDPGFECGHSNCSHIGCEFTGVVFFKSLTGRIEQVARYRDGHILENVNIWESLSEDELVERVGRITQNVYLMPSIPMSVSRSAESGGGGGGGSDGGHPVVYCPKCQEIHILYGTCVGGVEVVVRRCVCCGNIGHITIDCPMDNPNMCYKCSKPTSQCSGHNGPPSGGGGGGGGSGSGGSGSTGGTPTVLPNKTLVNTSKFVGHATIANCKSACDAILRSHGLSNVGLSSNVFKLMYETGTPRKLVKYGGDHVKNYKNAIDCINRHIDANRPITVGINRKIGIKDPPGSGRYRNEGATDHFVVISGRGYDSGTGLYYYIYYEVGTNRTDEGCDTNKNRFIYDPSGPYLYDSSGYVLESRYDVTQVRPNDGNTFGTIPQGYN